MIYLFIITVRGSTNDCPPNLSISGLISSIQWLFLLLSFLIMHSTSSSFTVLNSNFHVQPSIASFNLAVGSSASSVFMFFLSLPTFSIKNCPNFFAINFLSMMTPSSVCNSNACFFYLGLLCLFTIDHIALDPSFSILSFSDSICALQLSFYIFSSGLSVSFSISFFPLCFCYVLACFFSFPLSFPLLLLVSLL